MRYLPVFLLFGYNMVYGVEDCSQIQKAEDRLACFDKNFPSGDSVEEEPVVDSRAESSVSEPAVTETEKVIKSGVAPILATPELETTSITEPASQSSVEPAEKQGWKFPGKQDAVEISATVKDILNGDQQKMVFLLSNNQIWIQSTPRNLPIREGDEVTIKSGFIGGYFMRNQSGTSTRVRRID